MVIVEQLGKKYASQGAETAALIDINLEIGEGEFVCLLGPSGCGKSTMLNLIAGFESPTRGELTAGGKAITEIGRAHV